MNASSSAPFCIGKVTLTVHDLESIRDFYQNMIGLTLIREEVDSVFLGCGNTTLLELRHDASARRHTAREIGLFHTAFLLPSRSDLGHWLKHALEKNVALQGASDHLVSEAVYLSDPEGNGIEIYHDRPKTDWQWDNHLIKMATLPMDIDGVLQSAGTEPWHLMPEKTVVGHVHLQVGALAEVEDFYKNTLGFDITCHYPGATFFSSGGYHHHLATNTWNSKGAKTREPNSTGLTNVELQVEENMFDILKSKLSSKVIVSDNMNITLTDPCGIELSIRKKLLNPPVF